MTPKGQVKTETKRAQANGCVQLKDWGVGYEARQHLGFQELRLNSKSPGLRGKTTLTKLTHIHLVCLVW